MGADFKEKSRKSFEKSWDKAAVEANTPHLFRVPTQKEANRFEAEPIGDARLTVGQSAVVRYEDGKLIGRQGISKVLIISSPTEALCDAVVEGCGLANADVVSVDEISGFYEVTVR